MRAPIDDAGAMRPDAQKVYDEKTYERMVEGLLQRAKQGERRAAEELEALFGKHGGQADRTEGNVKGAGKPKRTLDRTASFGEGRGTYGSLGGQNVPRSFQDRVLNKYRSQYNQIINAPSARNRKAR
jgi:hypothetical protein